MRHSSSPRDKLSKLTKDILDLEVSHYENEETKFSIYGRLLLLAAMYPKATPFKFRVLKSHLEEVLLYNSYLDRDFHPLGNFSRYINYLKRTKRLSMVTKTWFRDPRRVRLAEQAERSLSSSRNSEFFGGAANLVWLGHRLNDHTLVLMAESYLQAHLVPFREGLAFMHNPTYLPIDGPRGQLTLADWSLPRMTLGNAHGVAGVLGALVSIPSSASKSAQQIALHLFETLVHVTHQTDVIIPAMWPPVPGKNFFHQTCGWCTGSPGIAYSTLIYLQRNGVKRHLSTYSWLKELFLSSTQVSLFGKNINGFSLCHGAAGIMEMSRCLASLTKDNDFLKRHREWLNLILETDEDSWDQEVKVGLGFDDYMVGKVGVCVALYAALSRDNKTIDQSLFWQPPEKNER